MYIRGYQPEYDGYIPRLERGEIMLDTIAYVNTDWCSREAADKVWQIAKTRGTKSLTIKTPTDTFEYYHEPDNSRTSNT